MDVVLGSTGFLGTNFCKNHVGVHLSRKHFDLTDWVDTTHFFLKKLGDLGKIGTLFHFAGKVGGIHSCSSNPYSFMVENLLMGVHAAKLRMFMDIGKMIYVGTVCSYPERSAITEKNLWNGYPEPTNAPYGIAKKTIGELLIAQYKEYNFKSVYPILANMYGPHDNFSDNGHVIPMLIARYHRARVMGKEEVVVWGTGNPTRDFLYVEDAVDAIHFLSKTIDKPYPINVGTGEEYPIFMVAKMISDIVGYSGKTVFDDSKPDGQQSRRVNIKEIKALGWSPKINLQTGLEKTYEYYIGNNP